MSWTEDVDAMLDFETAVKCLTRQERRVFCLYAGYLSQKEVADCLGISQQRVNELIEQAKAKLVPFYPCKN